jgi:DNA double-strand break repair helicase HerA and related ATPase
VPPPKQASGEIAGGGAAGGGVEAVGDFLKSRAGKRLQKQVMRGVFGMLKKRL